MFSALCILFISAWDQSDNFVKIFVTLKNVQTVESADVFCVFTSKYVYITCVSFVAVVLM
jgi:hypothetical protein